MGTEISISSSFATDVNVSLDVNIGLSDKNSGQGKGASLGFGVNSGFSNTSTSTNSETITKSQSQSFKLAGNGDGIDHSQDQLILILNPAVAVAQPQVDAGNNVCRPVRVARWATGLSAEGPSHSTVTEDIETLYIKWLIHPDSMPINVASDLKERGFTTEDFNALLALDPFVNGATTIDNTRYLPTTYSFPYQAPLTDPSCNGGVCQCLSKGETITNSLQSKATNESKTSYNVGMDEQLSGIDIGILSFGAKSSQKWTWTNSSTQSNLLGSNQSASPRLSMK